MLSYTVLQRTREVGIRLALGAPASNVVGVVLSGVAVMMALGLAIGAAGAVAAAGTIRGLLFEVEPSSMWSIGLPLIGLLVACAGATLVPVLRVTRIDPAIALRAE